MRLLGHEPEKVIWILRWLEEIIAGLRLTLEDGSTRGTAGTVGTVQGRSTTVCEGLCTAVEAEVEGIGTHVHCVVCCARGDTRKEKWVDSFSLFTSPTPDQNSKFQIIIIGIIGIIQDNSGYSGYSG